MRKALRSNPSRRQTGVPYSLPAPVDGWNTEDGLSAMKATYAVVLDNWIPRGGRIEMRRGFIDHVTGTSSPVETLLVYSGGATDKLFACAGTKIYDVTSSVGLGSAVYSSASSARWNWTNFANDAGRWMLAANGAQTPRVYDGSSWSASTISGTSGSITLAPADLKFVMQHQRILHWGEKERLRVWTLAADAVGGTAYLLDLGPYFSRGGVLAGMTTWSRDNGAGGADDLAVYVSSKGQVVVFTGTDPTDVNAWQLAGVYDIPQPVGDRCILKDGGEVCVVTEEGLLPLSIAVAYAREDQRGRMLSAKIATGWSSAVNNYGSLTGWQPIYYPGRGGLTIVNAPTEQNVSAVQFVRSEARGGWCRFTGIPAICWAYANGEIYFGGAAGVYQWDISASDNSEAIVPDVLTAFSAFGNRTVIKQFNMMRATMFCPAVVVPNMNTVVDYDQTTLPTATPTTVTPSDIDPNDGTTPRNAWTGANGVGYMAAIRMRFALTGDSTTDKVAVTEDLTSLLLEGPGGTNNILTRPNLPLDVQVEVAGFDLIFDVGGQL